MDVLCNLSYYFCNPVLLLVNCVSLLVEPCLTAYGNVWQAVLPFMELLVELCLTDCATMSYGFYDRVL